MFIDLESTIGKLRVPIHTTTETTPGAHTANISVFSGMVEESSICSTIEEESYVSVTTGSFELIGKSGTHYNVDVYGSTLQVTVGANTFTLWGSTHGSIQFTELYYNKYSKLYGICSRNVYYANDPNFYIITVTPAETEKAGYLFFTWRINEPQTRLYTCYDTTSPEGRFFEDIISNGTIVSPDPYDPGDGSGEGTSGPGGGTGNFDGTGDDIDIPGLPTLSATDAGFITLFNPSVSQMRNLATYMWSNPLFDLDAWKKIFADPMDAILGLSIVPVAVPNGGSKVVTVGNIPTGVSMTVSASQYVEVDCGTLNVNEYWGAYLDYDPYTKAEIYLPYCGTHPLAVDDIMGKAVTVKYHIDILSGACTAFVKCGGSVLYEFIGQCSSSIPITGDNWTNVINGVISIAGSIGTMVATGGASAPMAVTNIASTMVNTMKPSVEKSGAMGGTGGMLAVQTPYIILTRPRQALPTGQNTFLGYPSFINENLGSLSGYTEVEKIHLNNIPATEDELIEIDRLLHEGVIF